MVKLQNELEALRKRGAALSEKLAVAETELTAATAARQQNLVSGDLADVKTARVLQDAVNVASSQVVGFEDALAAVNAQAGEVERKIEMERTAAERSAAVEKLASDLDALEHALPAYLEAGRKLAEATDAIHFHFETTQMAAFLRSTSSQIEVAHAFALRELRAMVNSIAEGNAPIPPAKPQPALVAVIEPGPPMQEVFMIKSAKYRGGDNKMRYCGQYEDASMPAEIAQKALRCGAALSLTDDRRRHLCGSRGGDFNFAAADVVDLDNVSEMSGARYAPPNEVLEKANFVVLDRSREAQDRRGRAEHAVSTDRTMRNGPPGWQPHKITTRLDGWVGDYPCDAPRSVAEAIARTMPQLGEGNSVADIRARMIARHERTMRPRK